MKRFPNAEIAYRINLDDLVTHDRPMDIVERNGQWWLAPRVEVVAEEPAEAPLVERQTDTPSALQTDTPSACAPVEARVAKRARTHEDAPVHCTKTMLPHELSNKLLAALSHHMVALEIQQTENGEATYQNVTLYTGGNGRPKGADKYRVNVSHKCANIHCASTIVGAVIACAVRLDTRLQNDTERVYKWLDAMRSDERADAWIERVKPHRCDVPARTRASRKRIEEI